MKKLAILDTDFISKGHIIRINEQNHLIDRVLKLPGYDFFCHEQTVVELDRHSSFASSWLEAQIHCGNITKYTDERIIHEMHQLYFKAGLSQYTMMLKNACDAFDRDYFSAHFWELDNLNYLQISEDDYLQTLQRLDVEVGEGNNLGEIKEFVLLQWLNAINDEPVLYFCSDDKNARNGVLSLEEAKVQCVSVISAFQWLKLSGIFTKEIARPYIDSALRYYNDTRQVSIRVVEFSSIGRFKRIPYEQVFKEIFDGRFIQLPNGMLKYCTEEDPTGHTLFNK